MALLSVSIIGSGNLATHIAKALIGKVSILNIYSRNFNHASALANNVGATALRVIEEVASSSLIIICVSDSAIVEISSSLKTNALVVHTSGSTSLDVLSNHTNYGVLYPFQTFSKDIDIDFSHVPVFIEANNPASFMLLNDLAVKISNKVSLLTSEQRLMLHLSAVFANNFSNHMFAIAHDILQEANLPFDVLHHLIEETTAKALRSGDPASVQTGPAIRHNHNILDLHKEILALKPEWQKIYTFVSNSIIERGTNK